MSRIRELRQKRNLSQVELARILNVDTSTVSKWESGTNLPRSNILLELARVLKCRTDVLLSK
jgi:transcriptional regulator with XRE-family HTH domain